MSPSRTAPHNTLPLLIGEGAPPDQALSAFLRSAVSPVGPEVSGDASVNGFSVTLGATRFSCFRASPARIVFDGAHKLRLIFPYQGRIRVSTDHTVDDLFSGLDVGLYRAPVSEIVAPENASFLCVEIDRPQLFDAAAICEGVDQKEFFVRLEHALYARGVELQDCGVGYPALRHYFSHLNYYAANSRLALSLGLEELLYRYLVLLVFHRDHFGRRSRDQENREKLAALEDVIRTDPSRRFSLAEMSDAVGLSTRTLQKLCVTTYGVAPIEWQIGLRLDEARARLRNGGDRVSITTLAEDLGFSTPSRFTEQYRRKFGVTPREDLLQLRNSPSPLTTWLKKNAKRTVVDIFWIVFPEPKLELCNKRAPGFVNRQFRAPSQKTRGLGPDERPTQERESEIRPADEQRVAGTGDFGREPDDNSGEGGGLRRGQWSC